jgi:hypothetical protein
MDRIHRAVTRGRELLWQAFLVGSTAYIWILMSPLALAAKKKAVVEVDQGKGYTLPYMFVIAILSLGLMAVLRPGRRFEKADDQMKTEKEKE